MNADLRDEQDDFPLERVKQQLQALSAVEPPQGLKEKLLAAVPCSAPSEVPARRVWWWPKATRWAGIAAAIAVLCSVVWLRTTSQPGPRPSTDANTSLSRVLAADHNSVRPTDTNTFDSNGLY